MRLLGMRPRMIAPVDPHSLHAAGQSAQHVQSSIVSNVQNLLGRHAGGLRARMAKDGETVLALDEKTYTLDADTIVIADDAAALLKKA